MCSSGDYLGRIPQESQPCATPYRFFVKMPRPSSNAYTMNSMVASNHGGRCFTCWPAARPGPVGTWRSCGESIAIPSATGVRSMPRAAWLDLYVPIGTPLSLSPEVLAGLEQALRQPAGFASYEAVRQWIKQHDQLDVNDHTLYAIIRTRFNATRKVPRPSHTKKP